MDKQIDEVVDLVQRKVDQAFERGKEAGIAIASAPCFFCKKKTNECECGHIEITKRVLKEYASALDMKDTGEKILWHAVNRICADVARLLKDGKSEKG